MLYPGSVFGRLILQCTKALCGSVSGWASLTTFCAFAMLILEADFVKSGRLPSGSCNVCAGSASTFLPLCSPTHPESQCRWLLPCRLYIGIARWPSQRCSRPADPVVRQNALRQNIRKVFSCNFKQPCYTDLGIGKRIGFVRNRWQQCSRFLFCVQPFLVLARLFFHTGLLVIFILAELLPAREHRLNRPRCSAPAAPALFSAS